MAKRAMEKLVDLFVEERDLRIGWERRYLELQAHAETLRQRANTAQELTATMARDVSQYRENAAADLDTITELRNELSARDARGAEVH